MNTDLGIFKIVAKLWDNPYEFDKGWTGHNPEQSGKCQTGPTYWDNHADIQSVVCEKVPVLKNPGFDKSSIGRLYHD